ncbi:MAG: hypothetical protein EBT78_14110 [Betaproteobacteria bacterium]|nr:hypothetical protein [Betaproteobacteria bacterium]NBT68881.1 hypothetical protein [Betaproteobacteria bacterium]
MALPILDGNQSPATLSTIVVSSAHIPAHTVVSLGTQAKTDILSAVSSGIAISGTVTANLGLIQSVVATEGVSASGNFVKIGGHTGTSTTGNIAHVSAVGALKVDGSSSTQPISGTVTVGNATTSSAVFVKICGERNGAAPNEAREIQTDDGGFLYAVLADPSSPSSKAVIYDPVAGNSYVNVRQTSVQGTAVTTSNFTSTTPSTVLANFNATREVLTIFNEGAGNLHICAGATCTTLAYQVRLSTGDYYEVPNHQTTITHSAVFATAGTARVTQIS